ncbi:MAG: hypothetical protein RIG77_20345 [Cyclobacteriaceae bacterium]
MSLSANIDNPFPGLRAYQQWESDNFAAREEEKHILLKKLSETNFVAVVGSNGVGKTSFVNTQILAELRKGHIVRGLKDWKIVWFQPGKSPIESLANALSQLEVVRDKENTKIDSNLSEDFREILHQKYGIIEIIDEYRLAYKNNILLFIDHLDDLIFYSDQELEVSGRIFVDRLVEVVNQSAYPISVIGTLRTETVNLFSIFPQLAEIINNNQLVLGALKQKDLFPILDKVKASNNIALDTELTAHITDFYRSNPLIPGNFQHAMKRTIDNWVSNGKKRNVSLSNLRAVGGLDQSVNFQLRNIFTHSLDKKQQNRCILIFQALTGFDSENNPIVIPRSIQDLAQITNNRVDEIIVVVKNFTDPKCGVLKIISSQDIIDRLEDLEFIEDKSENNVWPHSEITISQSIVIDGCPILRRWMEHERNNANTFREIAEDVDRQAPYYEGEKLKLLTKWHEKNSPHPGWAMRYQLNFDSIDKFLKESKNICEQGEINRKTELISQKKSRRRNLIVTGLLIAFGVVSIVISLHFGKEAVNASAEAEQASLCAEEAGLRAQEAQMKADSAKVFAERSSAIAYSLGEKAKKAETQASELEAKAERIERETIAIKIEATKAEQAAFQSTEKADSLGKSLETKKLEASYRTLLAEINQLLGASDELIQSHKIGDNKIVIAANEVVAAYDLLPQLDSIKLENNPELLLQRQEKEKTLISLLAMVCQNLESKLNKDLSKIKYGTAMDLHPSRDKLIVGTDQNLLYTLSLPGNSRTTDLNRVAVAKPDTLLGGINAGIRSIKYSNKNANSKQKLYVGTVEGNLFVNNSSLFKKEHINSIFTWSDNELIVVDRSGWIGYFKDDVLIEELKLEHNIVATDFSQKNKYLILYGTDGLLQKIEIANFDEPMPFIKDLPVSPVSSIKILDKKNWIVLGTQAGDLIIYSINDRKANVLFSEADVEPKIIHKYTEHSTAVTCLETNPNNSLIISGGRNNVIMAWHLDKMASFPVDFKPIKFREFQAIEDIQFIDDFWFAAVSRGHTNDGLTTSSGRVSFWSADLKTLKGRLDQLKQLWVVGNDVKTTKTLVNQK